MEDTFADDAQKGGRAREDSSSHSFNKDGGLSGDNSLDGSESKSKRLVRRLNSQHTLILKVKQFQYSRSYIKESFLRSIRVLDSWIPKHMLTVDEKYLRRCLEYIHLSASKSAPQNISLHLRWGELSVLSNGFSAAKIENEDTYDFARLRFDCPLASGNGGVVISPAGHWIVGSIMGSKSMVNILNSPLFRKYGACDGDSNFEKASFNDVDGSICYEFMNSPGVLSNYSPNNLHKEAPIPGNNKYKSETLDERFVSMSSTNSTCSDQSSSSLSATITQGMLQCTWKGGNPHFVFSLDDQKVVYVANLWKVESTDDRAVDYTYLFHLRMGGEKEHEIHDSESYLVGKMKVSTSFRLGPNNSRIMEREFVLFGGNENFVRMQTSNHNLRKNKGLSKKVAEVFRTSHSMKKRTASRFSGSSAILESCPWEPFQETDNNIDALCGTNLLENDLPPNLELVAIVVKDRLPENRKEKIGGWGLNFLKKSNAKQTADSMESSQPPPGCGVRDSSDCSTSMDILIPAGLHGGPRTRNSGPSSLTERWRSGGRCDCGGWDLGCPLTVLKSRSSNKEISPQGGMQGECKLIDLIIQGSENSAPPLRMVNVYSGLYFVNFQSTLSALQSFSIAVAFIHAQSPALRPQNVQE
ncbi:hypothetical protein JCGZ_12860 [Jatropha curcas]|uniref:Uncharacterized protein n=1 Tax=Jatropha curcas TaxID=180498 RepID=A0A067KAR6_JATCU|nr:uncharacterized protein LOC105638411 [Jatropha curcas]XP_012077594.1 uncharacterized protein LOC105638411 [Jatropha curcas]XP_020536692.1 uncharacterized protein LOC105638411 [Jatropha curcas]KDP33311.1 hypothetical protein JCGZ_12860 [Jatropha curcas]